LSGRDQKLDRRASGTAWIGEKKAQTMGAFQPRPSPSVSPCPDLRKTDQRSFVRFLEAS
jgi:hypothetical protein